MLRALKRRLRPARKASVSDDFRSRQPELTQVIENVISSRLTYLPAAALADLADVVQEADSSGLEGAVVEAGTALGGSAIVLGRAKKASRPMLLYDVFGQIPPPSTHDGQDVLQRYEQIASGTARGIGGDAYYGYHEDLLSEVQENLASFDVVAADQAIRFVKGRYEETMPVLEPVAVAHIDCDWHDSVLTCLSGIDPQLVAGGRFVIDDYDAWSGARTAVDHFLASDAGKRYRIERRTRVHLVASG